MSIAKIQARIEALKGQETRKRKETVSLAAAVSKIEDKSPSKLWRKVQESPYSVEIYGLEALPEFKEWLTELISKPTKSGLYSEYGAFSALARMAQKRDESSAANKAIKALERAARQQAATEAK
jgi:hypothetical protein